VERAAAVERAGLLAQVTAQRGDQRAVRRAGAVTAGAAQDRRVRLRDQGLGQARLADAALAAHEHDRTGARGRALERGLEMPELRLPPDERSAGGHAA
jgi:hypothetical protein